MLVFVSVGWGRQQEVAKPIQDNSFLIEEAYNQEDNVVQHISNGTIYHRDFAYSFTQEWPLGGQAHQLSFTIPYLTFDSFANHGVGDILINYRYQALFEEHSVAVAPRASVILPTGSKSDGMGWGVVGLQFSVPASIELSEEWVTHLNIGTTVLPNVTGGPNKATLISVSSGASLIWLVKSTFNIMLEMVYNSNAGIEDDGASTREQEFILNPAIRGAINVGDLQIVPGIGVPLSFRKEGMRPGVFVYLSFEHPY
ncbi:MAG: transporter [Bacteroidota bacterium]